MNEGPLISIVVPIYNTQRYLRQCLDTICGQSYRNLDVVLVDDGSTDDSASICREFCEKDTRFRLIQQKNSGLGAARNSGLDASDGDYICFVDSDDRIHPDYIRLLYENLDSYQADLSICGFRITPDDEPVSNTGQKKAENHEIQIMNRTDMLGRLLSKDTITIVVAWNKLIAKNLLKNFRFENKWHEDQFMINEYIRQCSKAVLTTTKLYDYRARPDSIMGEVNKYDPRHLSLLEAWEQRIQYFYTEEYRELWKDLFLNYLNNKIYCFTRFSNSENAKELKRIIYPRYVWGFRQYMRIGGLFRKKSGAIHLFVFLISPRLYQKLKRA